MKIFSFHLRKPPIASVMHSARMHRFNNGDNDDDIFSGNIFLLVSICSANLFKATTAKVKLLTMIRNGKKNLTKTKVSRVCAATHCILRRLNWIGRSESNLCAATRFNGIDICAHNSAGNAAALNEFNSTDLVGTRHASDPIRAIASTIYILTDSVPGRIHSIQHTHGPPVARGRPHVQRCCLIGALCACRAVRLAGRREALLHSLWVLFSYSPRSTYMKPPVERWMTKDLFTNTRSAQDIMLNVCEAAHAMDPITSNLVEMEEAILRIETDWREQKINTHFNDDSIRLISIPVLD